MRKTAFLLTAGLLGMVAVGHAQTPPTPQASDINSKPTSVNINDVLVELGRKSQTNFMVDATHLTEEATPPSSDQNVNVGVNVGVNVEKHLEALSAKQKLSWLLRDDIVLVWAAPDLRKLGQQLMAGETIKRIMLEPPSQGADRLEADDAKDPEATKRPTREELLYGELTAYLRETYSWDDRTPGSVKEVKVSDLPPSLGSRVGAAVQASLLVPESSTIWNAWFTDEFWNNAQLGLMYDTNGNQNPNAPKIPVLVVGGDTETKTMRGGSMMSLGAIKGLPKF